MAEDLLDTIASCSARCAAAGLRGDPGRGLLAATTGVVAATVIAMGLISLP